MHLEMSYLPSLLLGIIGATFWVDTVAVALSPPGAPEDCPDIVPVHLSNMLDQRLEL